jgi:hypothetical protein
VAEATTHKSSSFFRSLCSACLDLTFASATKFKTKQAEAALILQVFCRGYSQDPQTLSRYHTGSEACPTHFPAIRRADSLTSVRLDCFPLPAIGPEIRQAHSVIHSNC